MSYGLMSPGDAISDALKHVTESAIAKNVTIVNQLIQSGKENGADCMKIKIDKSLKGSIGLHRKDISVGIVGEYSDYIEVEIAFE